MRLTIIGEELQPGVVEHHRGVWAGGEIARLRADSADAWLTSASAIVASSIENIAAVHAVYGTPHMCGRGWAVLHAGHSGYNDRFADMVSWEEAIQQGFPCDDFTPELASCISGREEAICGCGDQFFRALQGGGDNYLGQRGAFGLFKFVRAMVPLGPDAQWFMLQADALDMSWTPTQAQIALIGSLAMQMAGRLDELFLQPSRIRAKLIALLSPAQQRIAPLLAEGLSESAIAERVFRSPHTIHEHVREIYRLWSVQSREQLKHLWQGES